MRKHYRGMKKTSGTGKSRTLKERQLQIRRQLSHKGWDAWDLPFEGAVRWKT